MIGKSVFLTVLICFLPSISIEDQKQLQIDRSQRYLVLDTVRVKTLQQELNQAAAAGYRVAYGDASGQILVLEKTAEKYEYLVVDNFGGEFKTATAQAFHPVPTTFGSDLGQAIIMEKSTDATEVHDYVIHSTVRTGSLQNDLNQSAAKGYELVAISTYGKHNVLMEKRISDFPTDPKRYLLLATTRTSTMQKEINQAAANGYAVVAGSGGEELIIIMERVSIHAPKYLLLATVRTTTLEREINQAALRGFQPLPGTLLAIVKQRNKYDFDFGPDEVCIIMEQSTQTSLFTYRIIGTTFVGTFEKELAQAADEGFEMIGMTLSSSEQVGLLRRAGNPGTPSGG
jgi:hypothetical protein